MAINRKFYNYGESEELGDSINAEFLNELVIQSNQNETKTQHITADETKTTFDGTPVMHGSNEFVVTDEVGNVLSTSLNNIESEEI